MHVCLLAIKGKFPTVTGFEGP